MIVPPRPAKPPVSVVDLVVSILAIGGLGTLLYTLARIAQLLFED